MKRILNIVIIIVMTFMVCTGVARADDATAKCGYKIPYSENNKTSHAITVTYTYNRTKGTFSEKIDKNYDVGYGGMTLKRSLSSGDFEDSNGKLYCPTIYANIDVVKTRATTSLYTTKKSDTIAISPSTNKVTNAGGTNENLVKCQYNDNDHHVEFHINAKERTVVTYLDGKEIKSNFKYADLIKGEKACVAKPIVECTNVGGKEQCLVVKTSVYSGKTETAEADTSNPTTYVQTKENENYWAKLNQKDKYVCGGFVSDRLIKELNTIYNTISLAAVGVVIVLGALDFTRAVSSDDDGALKKAGAKFFKRVIIVAILVALPILLRFLLKLFGNSKMQECLNKIK